MRCLISSNIIYISGIYVCLLLARCGCICSSGPRQSLARLPTVQGQSVLGNILSRVTCAWRAVGRCGMLWKTLRFYRRVYPTSRWVSTNLSNRRGYQTPCRTWPLLHALRNIAVIFGVCSHSNTCTQAKHHFSLNHAYIKQHQKRLVFAEEKGMAFKLGDPKRKYQRTRTNGRDKKTIKQMFFANTPYRTHPLVDRSKVSV